MTLGKLWELANVTTEGATLESLARVGESLGFTTPRGVRATYQAVQGFELPCCMKVPTVDTLRDMSRKELDCISLATGRKSPLRPWRQC